MVTRAHADDDMPADDVSRDIVVGGAGLDTEMHDKGEPQHSCNRLAMVVGAIGVGWGQMPGDAEAKTMECKPCDALEMCRCVCV